MSQVPELIEEYSQSLEEIMATQVPSSADTGAVQSVSLKILCSNFLSVIHAIQICIHPHISGLSNTFCILHFSTLGDVIEHLMQKDNKMMNLVTQVRGEGLLGLFQEV